MTIYPLSRFAPSPKGDDTLGAGRPFLGASGFRACRFRRLRVARSALGN